MQFRSIATRCAKFDRHIDDRIDRFGGWARLLLGQMVDPSHPSPAMLNPPHHAQFVWAVVERHTTLVNSSPYRST